MQRVLAPDSLGESWTVLEDDGRPVEPVERFLAYLSDVERSPNTIIGHRLVTAVHVHDLSSRRAVALDVHAGVPEPARPSCFMSRWQ